MEFSVRERLILLNITPNDGNILTLRIVKDLKDAFALNEVELAELDGLMKIGEDGSVNLSSEVDAAVPPKEISLGPEAHKVIMSAFSDLDRRNKMQMAFLPLYDRLSAVQISEKN